MKLRIWVWRRWVRAAVELEKEWSIFWRTLLAELSGLRLLTWEEDSSILIFSISKYLRFLFKAEDSRKAASFFDCRPTTLS